MKLCRSITLRKDGRIKQAINPLHLVESSVGLLAGPCKMTFDSMRLAALTESPDLLPRDFQLLDDINMTWSILIIDNVNGLPLFTNHSGGRALLLMGEIIDNLFESFRALGVALREISPDSLSQQLVMTFSLEKGTTSRMALGAAMCLAQVVDALLFVRGLSVSSSTVVMPESLLREQSDFINLYGDILASIHAHKI